MKFLLLLGFVASVSTCVYGFAISSGEKLCPPPEQIKPCTCFKAPVSQRLTAECSNFTNAYDIKAIFDRNPGWNLQDVNIANAVMPYLPAVMLEDARFQSINVSSTTLITLFDVTPVQTPELNLYLYNVRVTRGFQWKSIANSSLLELGIWNTRIKNFGRDFKDNIPKGVQRLWFEGTGTSSITHQAFSELRRLAVLTLKDGNLKKITRDMLPTPCIANYLDFSKHRITTIPEDFFTEMPNLAVFLFEDNLLTTMSPRVFIKTSTILYGLNGNPFNCNCNMKWITSPGKFVSSLLKGECAEPEAFRGKKIAALKGSDFSYCT